MSITYQAKAIDDQMARLKLVFPDDYAYISVKIEKEPDNRTTYRYQSGLYEFSTLGTFQGGFHNTPKPAVDNLMHTTGITKVQEYLRINRHRFGSML